ncbi:MAG: DUF5676 family membrane protein [Alphaproteobacteria bacterium]|nr:DUF5676 family membrane protein [Alphaproteobacteria bacterium]
MTSEPWRIGAALALTVAVSYPVCAILYVRWPERGIEFLNALFHGLDFSRLATGAPARLSSFYFPFVVLVVWGLLAGTLFGWLHRLFSGRGWHP